MDGFTPVEQDRRDALEAMTPEQRQRARWYADVRRVLSAAEACQAVPLPLVFRDRVRFALYEYSPAAIRMLGDAEAELSAALHVTFSGGADEDRREYVLEAVLESGMQVQIANPASYVAEKKVTGTTVVETVEWVRLPAVPETADENAAADDDEAAGVAA
ncbi:MAG TPA: hypothetical protein VKU77_19435 [Streptosporangiaceae bacterium]|nr:hypothetical protein [Streptosporangiaceae bacterium]